MTKYRLLAALLAAVLPVSLFGCSASDIFGSSDKSSVSDSTSEETSVSGLPEKYAPIELDDVRAHVEQLLADAESPNNSDTVLKDRDTLINDLDTISEALSYINIAYYADWNNEELEEEYDSCYETYYIASDLLSYAFSNCYIIDEYAPVFEDYISPDYLDYYTNRAMSLDRLIGYASVDYSLMDENLDSYYDILNDYSKKDKTKNLEAAEIYLDILAAYDTEIFYDSYNRDFTAEEAIGLTDAVIKDILPAMNDLENALPDIPYYDDIYNRPILFDNSFEAIAEYAEEISPEIADSAQFLTDNELYCIAEGSKCYTGSFTIDLPLENSAVIYVYNSGDYYDFLTAVHEFGHFYSSFYDETPTYLMKNNIDIAEIQSQGMEVLFMELYGDIYGKQAEAMRALKLYDFLDSVTSGFAVGEFEYTVLKQLDTITPEEVVELFDSIMLKYGYEDVEFYYITHLFEQPGYYISYGVSALAALNIWIESLNSYDKAVDMYNNISQIPINSDKFQFKSALEHCGFSDVLNEQYIKDLGAEILEYAESLR